MLGGLGQVTRQEIRFAIIVAVTFALGLVLGHLMQADAENDLRQTEKIITCQEDESCWDCETMGNRRCGP